jgi:hypothetical protein
MEALTVELWQRNFAYSTLSIGARCSLLTYNPGDSLHEFIHWLHQTMMIFKPLNFIKVLEKHIRTVSAFQTFTFLPKEFRIDCFYSVTFLNPKIPSLNPLLPFFIWACVNSPHLPLVQSMAWSDCNVTASWICVLFFNPGIQKRATPTIFHPFPDPRWMCPQAA